MTGQETPTRRHDFLVEGTEEGTRLDVFLAARIPEHSRSFLARQVRAGNVTVNGTGGPKVKPGVKLEAGDRVAIDVVVPRSGAAPEPMPLDILHEDDRIIVIDKPPGLTVHPGNSERSGTLANALVHHFETLSEVSGDDRPGIVHRLDKETSGVMLVARDDAAHHDLADQFRAREVEKVYLAVVKGVPDLDADLIDLPLGVHPRHPTRMAVRLDVGKSAQTLYQVMERFEGAALVRCRPRTGRTHQIRVHMASVGHPVLGDRIYGGVVPSLQPWCPRHALHAWRITLRHPGTGEKVTYEAALRADLRALVEHLRGEVERTRGHG